MTDRPTFESWAKRQLLPIHVRDTPGASRPGEYGNHRTQLAWEAWEACRFAIAPEGAQEEFAYMRYPHHWKDRWEFIHHLEKCFTLNGGSGADTDCDCGAVDFGQSLERILPCAAPPKPEGAQPSDWRMTDRFGRVSHTRDKAEAELFAGLESVKVEPLFEHPAPPSLDAEDAASWIDRAAFCGKEIADTLLLAVESKQDEDGDSAKHARWMADKLAAREVGSATKTCRWLGYLQGWLVASLRTTLQDEKDRNLRSAARAAEGKGHGHV